MFHFGGDMPHLPMISILVMNFISENCKECLEKLGQDLISLLNLQLYADSIHVKRAALHSCWGSFYGIVNPVCRPYDMERVVCNGHKSGNQWNNCKFI